MDRIYWLSQIENSEKSLVGDEIFILSQLLNYGYPVLPGLVIDRSWLSQLLANSSEYRSVTYNSPDYFLQLNVDDDRVLQPIAKQCRQLVEALVIPSEWETTLFDAASKFNSLAVILEPYFFTETGAILSPGKLRQGQACWLDRVAISEGIKRVWSRLFTAQSIFYWHKLGMSVDRVNCAVLIQPLSPAIASGTLDINEEAIVIRAVRGLEFGLWRGEVDPDRYRVDRTQKIVIEQQRGCQERAYRLSNDLHLDLADNPVEPYSIDEAETESWVLESEAISSLIELTAKLLQERSNLTSCSWSLLSADPKIFSQPQFYITHLEENYPLTVERSLPKNDSEFDAPLLIGLAAAKGQIFGEVIISPDLNLPSSAIPIGSILVTKSIPPDKIFLLKRLGGIITEIGGMTSHGAIVARELGIPAIINAVNATRILQQETKILLDGNTGKVYRQNIELYSEPKLESFNASRHYCY